MVYYLSLNMLFVILCLIGQQIEDTATTGSIVYLILLFGLCSTPLFVRNLFYGKYLLYTLFLAYMFVLYGLFYFIDLFMEFDIHPIMSRDGFFSYSEPVILIGISSFIVSFVGMSNSAFARESSPFKINWKINYMLWLGVVSWLLGAYVYIDWAITTDTLVNLKMAQDGFSGIYVNLRSLMMLGELMIIFVYLITRHRKIGILVILLIVSNLVIGFITDSKEVGFRPIILYLVVSLIVSGKIDFKYLLVSVVIITIGFSLFAQMRDYRHVNNVSIVNLISDFENIFDKGISRSEGVTKKANKGLEYLLWRMSLNGSSETVIGNTGDTVPYKNGATLKPVIYVFLPRFILPNKPDANIGRVVNKEFKVSESELTYISIGQLAEFYWNFGVLGVVLGMAFIGSLLAYIGAALNLAKSASITRLLLLLTTVYVLILKFEGGFATYYTLWMRMMFMILVINIFMPKQRKF